MTATLANPATASAATTGPARANDATPTRPDLLRIAVAGRGELAALNQATDRVARRASALVVELGAPGEVGAILAHRVSVLSFRLEESATLDRVSTALAGDEARVRFDRDRLDALNALVQTLKTTDEPRPVLGSLEASPEGLTFLTATWTGLRANLRSLDPRQALAAVERVSAWLGLSPEEVRDLERSGRSTRVDAEIDRLHQLTEAMRPTAEAVHRAREQAAILARFDPSREATLARRHEAAAERGLYRALQAIRDLQRDAERRLAPVIPAPLPPPSPPQPVAKTEVAPLRTEANPSPLGSFRAAGFAPVGPPVEPPQTPEGAKKKRPDLRKLNRNRR